MIPRADHLNRSPLQAFTARRAYSGPNMLDKGQQDGSCNRTACQLPLRGMAQYRMTDHKGGWLHYCTRCADMFLVVDMQNVRPPRCELVEDGQ